MLFFLLAASAVLGACMLLAALLLLVFKRFRSHAFAIIAGGVAGGLVMVGLFAFMRLVVQRSNEPLLSQVSLAVFAAGFGWAGLLAVLAWSTLDALRFPMRWVDRHRARSRSRASPGVKARR
jgi:hypothetical protein